MSSRSTSILPKSQLTINLDLGWECPSLPSEENKDKKKRKFLIKDWEKAKEENSQSKIGRKQKRKKKVPDQRLEESKRRKFPIKDWEKTIKKENSRSKIGRKQKTYVERSLDQTISEQYRIVTSKQERNHDLKWSPPFDCQPKSCALATFSPRTKQKQKRKRPKHSEPNSPPKTLFPKEKSYWSMITHNLWYDRKWFAKSSHDISMVRI